MKCNEKAKWILDQRKGSLGHKITDKKSLRCAAPYENRPLLQVVEIIEVGIVFRIINLLLENVHLGRARVPNRFAVSEA